MKSNLTKIVSILDYIFHKWFSKLELSPRDETKNWSHLCLGDLSLFSRTLGELLFSLFEWQRLRVIFSFVLMGFCYLSDFVFFYNLNILSKKYLSFSKIFPHTNTLTTTYLRKKKLSTENVAFPIASNVNRWSNWKNNTKLPAIKESPLMINESELSL